MRRGYYNEGSHVELDTFLKEIVIISKLTTNSIPLVRRELEGVLLGLLFYLVKNKFEYPNREQRESLPQILSSFRENFSRSVILKEFRKLESFCLKNSPLEPNLSQSIADKTIVELSPFSYECLMTFITRKNLTILNNELSNAVTIKIGDGRGPSFMRTSLPLEDLENINTTTLQPFPLRVDTQLIQTLDCMLKKKKPVIQSMDSDPSSIPESKLKQKIQFSKSYLARKLLDDDQLPSVIAFTINDSLDCVSATEVSKSGSVCVFGYIDGSIVVFYGVKEEIKNHTFYGHQGQVTCLSIQYDDLIFLSGSSDGTIRLWCVKSLSQIAIFTGHKKVIWSIDFSPKGFYFASGGFDCYLRIWTTDKISPQRLIPAHKTEINIVRFFANSLHVATCAEDNVLKIFDIQTAECVRIICTNEEEISLMVPSFSGKFLVVASNKKIMIWNVLTASLEKSFEESQKIMSFALTSDDSHLATCSRRELSIYSFTKILKETSKDAFACLYPQEKIPKASFSPLLKLSNRGEEFMMKMIWNPKNILFVVTKALF